MAKKIRFKDLTTEDKMELVSQAGRGAEEDISLNKQARQEYRKRKKDGTLESGLYKRVEVEPYEMPTNEPERVDLPITVAVTKQRPDGEYYTVQEDIEASSTLDEQRALSAKLRGDTDAIEEEKKKINSLVNSFDLVDGTPTDYVTKKAGLGAVNARLNGLGVINPDEINAAEEKSTLDILSAAELNKQYSQQGDASKKLADKIILAENNPDETVVINREDIEKAIPDLSDSVLTGDPDVKKKIDAFQRMLQLDNVRYSEPAIERLGLQDYYPDISQPLAVGSYSGRIVGSNPIFVAGGQLLPMGIIDARRRAIEGAAKRKAAMKDKIIEMVYAKGAAQYQDQLDNMTMNLIQKYGEKTGWNWADLASYSSKNSLEFWKEVKDVQSLGKVTLATQAKADALTKVLTGEDGASKGVFIPPQTERMIMEWNKATFDMETFWKDKKAFNSLVSKFQSYDDMTYYAGNAAKELAAQKDVYPIKIKSGLDMNDPQIATALQDIYTVSYHNDYDRYVKALGKFVDDDRINTIAANLHKNHKFFTNEQQTREYITAMIGKEIDLKEEIAKKYNVEMINLKKKELEMRQAEKMTVWTNVNNNANNPELKDFAVQVSSSNLTPDQKKTAIYKTIADNIGMTHVKDANGKPSDNAIFKTNVTPEEQAKTAAISLQNAYMFSADKKVYMKASSYYNHVKSKGKNVSDDERNFLEFYEKNPNAVLKGNLYEKRASINVNTPEGGKRVFTSNDINNPYAIANWTTDGELKYNSYYEVQQIDEASGKTITIKKATPPVLMKFDIGNEVERAQLDALESKSQRLYKESYQQGAEQFMFEEPGTPQVEPTSFDE